QYMTATTDFAAQADILEAAATSLIGIDLPGLSTAPGAAGSSGQAITANDVLELGKVIAAVELRRETNCLFATILKPAPALCEGANSGLALFFENFEAGLGGFTTSSQTSSGTWTNRAWVQAPAPAGHTGNVAFAVNGGGSCSDGSNEAGIIRIESPVINIPAGTAGNLSMAFDHYVAIEDTWDGGNIKYAINGGAWTLLPASAFTANGYNNFLNAAGAGNNNPMQAQPAFTGTDGGSVTGSWGQSQIDLTSLGLVAGNTIQLRFELGTDQCGRVDGWYVDDIRVYTCAVTPAVHFVAESATINEGEGTTPAGCFDYVDKIITLQIDKVPTQPVTVTFNTPGGTAKNGATGDYTIFPASVSLSSGSLTQNVTLRIYNDAYVEGEETIDLSYNINTNGGNGYAAAGFQTFRLTIIDDDLTPGNYTEELLSSNFDNGQQGWLAINGGNSFHTWEVAKYSNAGLDAQRSPFFFMNSNIVNGSFYLMDEILESPPINTEGKKNLVLTFSQNWRVQLGSYPEEGLVDVWDGTTWHNILTQNEATGSRGDILSNTPDIQNLAIPDAYANVNMKVRFRYKSNSEIWWAIDLVKVTATNSTDILTTINTGSADQEYLGPNETAVFYDPATGNLMAKIKNLSAHDYGCTTVEVDRQGANGTAWMGGYQVTNKTFKVTPTTNNPNGQFEITIYYKASELTASDLSAFTVDDVNSMGKSSGSIATGNAATTALVDVVMNPVFNGDYSFTSTFTSGFSGFGLSDAPAGSALPVTLVQFEGKNTAEGNQLNWTTSSEVNNAYFVIEESLNARIFTESGQVQGMGSSAVTNEYRFTDVGFNTGITYYRLKQVDTDGKFAYSKIIAIDALKAGNIKFYPNPVQSVLNVELPDMTTSWVNARIINASGQEVMSKEKVNIRNGKLNMSLGRLPSGIYQVLISNDKATYHLSVVKL
ncbi:MAG: T9SS type A sorting domain-containing protein, partial [Dyadobacter sp.]|uniref:T9SS type A sorting domain-containing protein n=1 Tax=Dyadobacter sp. TaxID=1914288 RepID=UPI003266943B